VSTAEPGYDGSVFPAPGSAPGSAPDWLDRSEYPFRSRSFATPAGAMHYLDEGEGRPVVFVHGNPSWSFGWRKTIAALLPSRRCIAADHLGFGLSDKPAEFSYLPADHARNFAALMQALDLRDITLVVGDWGGPIGLSYALDHPDRVAALVVTNTWMWSVRRDWYYQGFSRFMGGPLGRWLIRKHNFFAARVLPAAFGDKRRLTPAIHRHYLAPLASPAERKGCWVLPGQIIGASPWLASLWQRREALAGKPMLIAWGMKDIAFRKKELARWTAAFPAARVVRYDDCGHYVAEEHGEELAEAIARLGG
jgi:haloalkane dehalogenase